MPPGLGNTTRELWELLVRIAESNSRQSDLLRDFADRVHERLEYVQGRLEKRIDRLLDLQQEEAAIVRAIVSQEVQQHMQSLQLKLAEAQAERRDSRQMAVVVESERGEGGREPSGKFEITNEGVGFFARWDTLSWARKWVPWILTALSSGGFLAHILGSHGR